MSTQEVRKFYEQVGKSELLKEEMDQIDAGIKGKQIQPSDLARIAKEKIIPLAKNNGYNFSESDLFSYFEEQLKVLDIADLDQISGGVSQRAAGIGLGAIMLLGLGGTAAMNLMKGQPDNGGTSISQSAPQDTQRSRAKERRAEAFPGSKTNKANKNRRTAPGLGVKKAEKIERIRPKSATARNLEGRPNLDAPLGGNISANSAADQTKQPAQPNTQINSTGNSTPQVTPKRNIKPKVKLDSKFNPRKDTTSGGGTFKAGRNSTIDKLQDRLDKLKQMLDKLPEKVKDGQTNVDKYIDTVDFIRNAYEGTLKEHSGELSKYRADTDPVTFDIKTGNFYLGRTLYDQVNNVNIIKNINEVLESWVNEVKPNEEVKKLIEFGKKFLSSGINSNKVEGQFWQLVNDFKKKKLEEFGEILSIQQKSLEDLAGKVKDYKSLQNFMNKQNELQEKKKDILKVIGDALGEEARYSETRGKYVVGGESFEQMSRPKVYRIIIDAMENSMRSNFQGDEIAKVRGYIEGVKESIAKFSKGKSGTQYNDLVNDIENLQKQFNEKYREPEKKTDTNDNTGKNDKTNKEQKENKKKMQEIFFNTLNLMGKEFDNAKNEVKTIDKLEEYKERLTKLQEEVKHTFENNKADLADANYDEETGIAHYKYKGGFLPTSKTFDKLSHANVLKQRIEVIGRLLNAKGITKENIEKLNKEIADIDSVKSNLPKGEKEKVEGSLKSLRGKVESAQAKLDKTAIKNNNTDPNKAVINKLKSELDKKLGELNKRFAALDKQFAQFSKVMVEKNGDGPRYQALKTQVNIIGGHLKNATYEENKLGEVLSNVNKAMNDLDEIEKKVASMKKENDFNGNNKKLKNQEVRMEALNGKHKEIGDRIISLKLKPEDKIVEDYQRLGKSLQNITSMDMIKAQDLSNKVKEREGSIKQAETLAKEIEKDLKGITKKNSK